MKKSKHKDEKRKGTTDQQDIMLSSAITEEFFSLPHSTITASIEESASKLREERDLVWITASYTKRMVLPAISNEIRRAILKVLLEPMNATDVEKKVKSGLTKANTLSHLHALQSSGLVDELDGLYFLTAIGRTVRDFLSEFSEAWLQFPTGDGSRKRMEIIEAFRFNEDVGVRLTDMADIVGLGTSEIYRYLKELTHAGLVEKGPHKNSPYFVSADGITFYGKLDSLVKSMLSTVKDEMRRLAEDRPNALFLLSVEEGLVPLSLKPGAYLKVQGDDVRVVRIYL